MSTPIKSNLLRRTTVAVAAVAGLLMSVDSTAANVTLKNGNGNTCIYTGMNIDPAGNVNVDCSGTATNPTSPGTFALSATAFTATAGSTTAVTVLRSGGTTGSVAVTYGMSGAGCSAAGAGTLSFSDGQSSSSFNVPVGASGVCNVSISVGSGATLGSPSAATVTVSGSGGGTTPTPAPSASCPTGFSAPQDLLDGTLGGNGNVLLQMQKSGQVVSIPLPTVPTFTGQVAFGESAGGAYTPQPVTLEISISKCKGLIDTNRTNNYCNLTSTNGNYNSITWFAKAYSRLTDAASATQYGYCWAGDSGGQYYINARWTYNSCAFGAGVCGFAIQWNQGPY